MKYRLLLLLPLMLSCADTPVPGPPGFPEGTLVDLTYAFDSTTIFWPTANGFELSVDARGRQEAGYWYEANSFSTAEHGGTHLDAPVHFSEGQWTTDAIPLTRLIGPAVVVDVSEAALANRDYLVSVADFERWESEHGLLPDGVIVLVRTGYGAFWPDREQYMGTAERGPDAIQLLHFPGIAPEAASWLATERTINAIGIDTPSIDTGQSQLYEAHQNLFAANIPAFENVANLDRLPASGATVIALPMKITGGSGGPLRIVAVVPDM